MRAIYVALVLVVAVLVSTAQAQNPNGPHDMIGSPNSDGYSFTIGTFSTGHGCGLVSAMLRATKVTLKVMSPDKSMIQQFQFTSLECVERK